MAISSGSISATTISSGTIGGASIEQAVSSESVVPNVPPTVQVPGAQTVVNVTALTFAGTISVADSDATTLTVTLTALHGIISLSGTTGLTFTTGNGVDDITMSFSGTVTAINTALTNMTYTSSLGFVGTDTLTVEVDDGEADPVSDTISITVTFNPTAYGTVTSWFDATDDSSVTHTAGAVTQWNDKSSNSLHATTTAGSPTYDAAGDTVTFDGSDDYMTSGAAANYRYKHDGSTWSTVFVGRPIDNGSGNVFFLSEGSGAATQRCVLGHNRASTEKVAGSINNSGGSSVQSFLSDNNDIFDYTVSTNFVYGFRWINAGNTINSFFVYRNSVLVDDVTQGAATPTTTGGSGLIIGGGVGGASLSNVVFKEIIEFTPSLSEETMQLLSTALMLKHGLS